MNWTKEQEDAIYKKDSNILVAAAAGSGKTAVLVERIIQKILKDGVDIDKLLVVTFTNAAASEMRERVLEAIYKKLDEEPENENLQKQIILLGKSNICTIHSFCLDVIKNNFFEIDLSANFRIAAEEEIELLKQEVLENVFEKLYDEEDENFAKLVDTYTGYRGDEPLKEIVLKIYRFMQSSPFPKEWLLEKVRMFENTEEKDFAKSAWGKILIKNLQEEIIDGINSLKVIRNKLEKFYELEKYKLTIESDIEIFKALYDAIEKSWDAAYEVAKELKLKSWPIDKKIVMDAKDEAKASRDTVKNKLMKIIKEILIYDSESAYRDIYAMHEVLDILKDVIFSFDEEFMKKKRERNIIDFNDIEHYALKILVKKDENGNYVGTDVAKKYREKFEEIAIDEYQDSNQVQEYILSTVSRGNNLFMVGDVKQSIYKFRQACPELFLDKYDRYDLNGNDDGLKIQLFKNFRSRDNVLQITNNVFKTIMSKVLGDIDYTEEEYLNLGASFEPHENSLDIAELDIIDLKDDDSIMAWKNEDDRNENESAQYNEKTQNKNVEKISGNENDEEFDDFINQLEKEQIEAQFVVRRIKELIDSKVQVKDKKLGYRNVTYKDIVILLRSTSKLAPIYEKELIKNDIPVFSDSSNEYLDTIEIQTIINLLKILDNPIDDIALVSVLRSEIGTFDDNEIVEIRLCKRDGNFYDSLLTAKDELQGELKEKVNKFLNNLDTWRKESEYLSLAELIWKIYTDTGFFNYVGLMPNGLLRQANLKMLFERAKEYEKTSFKGLFNFIMFVERLKSGNSDMSSAKIIGENENVVRIMSIHKSKGLEFPIVFLCSTSKKINMQDLNSNLLLHQKLGIGPQYINYEKMVEYSTSAKDAIKIIIKEESISEEMRILYVALTRAKEKLIITGTSKDHKKEVEKKKEILKVYNSKDGKLNPIILKKYISYLDWIELVLLNSEEMKELIKVNEYSKKDIITKEEEKELKIREFDFEKEIDFEKYEKEFGWNYENELATKLPIKSTVSKIKEMQNEGIDFADLGNKEIGIAEIKPEFLEVDEKISASRKGTLMHLFMQKIDFRKDYNLQDLENLKQELIARKIISEEEASNIRIDKTKKFLETELYKKIKVSKIIEKEKAFCMKMQAREVFEDAKDENILVQGIIDLYSIDEKDNVILLDYKTDYVENGNEEELVKKYKNQLRVYKKALEEATRKNVKEVYIYSLYLNKEIKINL